MTLNRRHKAILFLTLVFTGCALLLGSELKVALGAMMLGVALAWAVGSDAASKMYSGAKGASGTFSRWIRLPVAMTLAGGLLGAFLTYSRANPVVVVALMCVAGIVVAPLTSFPTQKIWLRIPLILFDGFAFFLAVGGMISTDLIASNLYGKRFGELAVVGFVILLVGIFWLSKGWGLVQKGITAPAYAESMVLAAPTKKTSGQYISLFFGVLAVTLWLSLAAWFASSAWAYAPEKTAATNGNNNLLAQVGLILLLAWWPYGSWKSILSREPNSEPRYLRRHRRVTVLVGMIFVLALSLSVTYGTQNGNDQRMVEKITAAAKDLTDVGTKIGAIKQRDLRTTGDYIQAYTEIEMLLPEYESDLQKCSDTYQEARKTDETRGLINTQVFHKSHTPNMWKDNFEMLDLIRQADSLTRQEVLTVHNMAALPASEQVNFWHREFEPFIGQENILREKLQAVITRIQARGK